MGQQQSRGPEEADYVVVGAGTAGCVLADRLSADGRSSVLVLEAGGPTTSVTVKVPALIQKQPTRLNWLYDVEPDPSRGGIGDPYSAGRGLGGSSAINAMLWTRGNPADYDSWADAGATGWDHASVLPYLQRAERFEDPAAPLRGADGPVSVARTRVRNPMTDHFLRGAAQAGFPALADYNGPVQEGASYSQVNQRRGLRHSTADAYLARAGRRPNLTVVPGAEVTRVVVARGRATAVEYVRDDGSRHHVRARVEVVLAAGAIGSPKLLLLSGVGPADALRSVGVEVVADVPGVGRGLQEHPATSLVYGVTERTVNQEVTPLRLVKHGLDFVLRGRGALTTTANHAVAFCRADPAAGLPDTELVFMAFGLQRATGPEEEEVASEPSRGSWLSRATARSGGREEGRKQVATAPLVTVTAVLLHPHGRGEVVLRSKDPRQPPLIRQALLGDPRDLAGLTRAARRVRDVFATAALAPYVTGERSPGPLVGSDEEWAEHLRSATFRMFHPSGTCRMGGPDAVVDERLRVRGVGNLRVVDASVMPHLPSGNTQAPTVMIGERGSDLVLEDRP